MLCGLSLGCFVAPPRRPRRRAAAPPPLATIRRRLLEKVVDKRIFREAELRPFLAAVVRHNKQLDAALTPERVEADSSEFDVGDGAADARWDMTDGIDGWLRAPGLRILSGPRGRAAALADGLPVCEADRPLWSGCDGDRR